MFAFYAASGDFGSVTDMDRGEYWKFVKDCHFQKDRKLLPSVRVDLIFQKACMDKSLEGKARSMSAVDEIGPPTWIECLVRICSWKFRNNKKKFVANFKHMYEEELLPNACRTDTDRFRAELATEKVTDVFAKYRKPLKKLFVYYAAADQTDEGVADGALDTMNVKELTEFCSDIKLIGATLSIRKVRTIFAFVQQEDEEELESDDEADDNEMVFTEFNEASGAIATFMRPDPYVMLDNRIKDWFLKVLFPRARDDSGIQVFKNLKWPKK